MGCILYYMNNVVSAYPFFSVKKIKISLVLVVLMFSVVSMGGTALAITVQDGGGQTNCLLGVGTNASSYVLDSNVTLTGSVQALNSSPNCLIFSGDLGSVVFGEYSPSGIHQNLTYNTSLSDLGMNTPGSHTLTFAVGSWEYYLITTVNITVTCPNGQVQSGNSCVTPATPSVSIGFN